MAKGAAVPLAPWSRMSPTLAHNGLLIDVLSAVLAERPMPEPGSPIPPGSPSSQPT